MLNPFAHHSNVVSFSIPETSNRTRTNQDAIHIFKLKVSSASGDMDTTDLTRGITLVLLKWLSLQDNEYKVHKNNYSS